MTYQHPIRKSEVHVFRREDGQKFIAKFTPYSTWPIIFIGNSAAEVRDKAEEFRADVIEKNESGYAKRQAALEKARAARKEKKEAS